MHCLNPHACALEASARLDKITLKLNPLSRLPPHDNLLLTATRKARNEIAKRRDENITFDPSMTSKTNLAECFRVFINPEKISNLLATCNITPPQDRDLPTITVYTDGVCFNNRKQNTICRSGVWFGPDDQRNTALKVPGQGQSNQIGEICAVIVAIERAPSYQPMIIASDSKYVIDGLTTHLEEWENKGWTEVKKCNLQKSHAGTIGNEQSDLLAKQGAIKDNNDRLDLEIPKEFDLQGARLASLTQAATYRGIKECKPDKP
jgi:ribonuclease HI